MQEFGDKLKICRTAFDLTQDELARRVGSTKQVISRYESNLRSPKVFVVSQYAKALDVPTAYLADPQISFSIWDHPSYLEDYWNEKSPILKARIVQQRGIDPRIASDYFHTSGDAEKAAAQKGGGLDPLDAQLMDWIHRLTDDQKRMLLAQIKTLIDLQG